ncbi:SCO family protein [Haoranjiania flava]|uniref:SCO family protein n=2 Tax=Haoranjiania flava TaxID=1856322 RepID=A0AAE3LJ16_9BACT|nr:SCO family protein [Haoranjiania flava]MCU7693148.1 SCO family protein [Haoranjiania flava]
MRNKILWIYLGFFAIVVLVFWLLTFMGTDNWKKQSPVLSYVQPFSFTNQDGKAFTDNDMKNKVTVVEYFFTTCQGICPKLNTNMKKVYERFRGNPEVQFVSHTCMPENDSVPVLKRYADSLGVDTRQWVFLTGRKDSLYQMARTSYLLDDPANNVKGINDEFIHTQFWALVDKNGKVRSQIFDGLKKKDVNKIVAEIETLLKEE